MLFICGSLSGADPDRVGDPKKKKEKKKKEKQNE